MKDGKPYFAELQRRALMFDPFKIALAVRQLPVSFTAFDILYRDGLPLMDHPLMEHKRILSETVTNKTDRFVISRHIETEGVALGLEGIISKPRAMLSLWAYPHKTSYESGAWPINEGHPFATLSKGNESMLWLAPMLICAVKYMKKTHTAGLRQPTLKCLRGNTLQRM